VGHRLPPLPYAVDALEPHVDAETLRRHHEEVHLHHVERLGRALERTRFAALPTEELLPRLDEILDGPITAYRRTRARHHGGAHLNHSLLWTSLRPPGGPGPDGALAKAVAAAFGGRERLEDRMSRAARSATAPGWVWLVHDGRGLAVTTTSAEDNPVMDGLVPLLGIDLWEHAYFARHGVRRERYVEELWPVVDWERVGARLAAAGALPAAGPPERERPPA
jgi:superoxide dismutase, Fe-Mn family